MKWRVIPLATYDAATNMAMDEAVSESVAKGEPPTIRFYQWNPSAISIGYFQCLEDEVATDKCKAAGVDIVRRRTGGGAVLHDREITYSVIAPVSMFPTSIRDSYQEICSWIIAALSTFNITAEFKPINDILVNGKKISGNAQTRRNKVLLQHGTILYQVEVEKMFSLLKVGQTKMSDKFIQSVKKIVTSVKQEKKYVSLTELYEALLKAFTEGKEWELGKLTEEEQERTEALIKERYSREEWNRGR